MKTNPDSMWGIYIIKPIPYKLRPGEKLYSPKVNTILYGLNSLVFHRSLLWNNLPTSSKISQSLANFKKNLRQFGEIYCKCVVCR